MVKAIYPLSVEGGISGKNLPPSCGRGMPEGQGVGRRRKRAKPTSGTPRHLLPEEGGRVPFPCIVISSESEKSFSFAVRRGCEECGERETPCFM